MLGSSRESLQALRDVAAARSGEPGFLDASAELLSVVTVLAADKGLRTALADAGQSSAGRENLARDVFGSKVGVLALDILVTAASKRWSSADDIVEAIEAVAAQIVFADADRAGQLDRIESELFAFDHAVSENPELQMALTNPALPAAAKTSVVSDVLAGRAHAGTEALLRHLAANLRGRRVDVAIKSLSDGAAAQRHREVAEVRVAIALSADQAARLRAVLARLAGREVSLNVVVDSSVIGGVSVRLGDDVFDGSVRSRLEQARRVLVG